MPQRTPLKAPGEPHHPAALILIDWISDWRMNDGARLRRRAEAALDAAAGLLASARRHGVPVIYANDNRGQWRSDFRTVVAQSRAAGPAAARVTDRLAPAAGDYFVLKPKHSAFHATPLDLLLRHLHTRTIVLAGVAGNQCVLATAIGAHMRDLQVVVVSDASASLTAKAHAAAMAQCRAFGCGVRRAAAVRWNALAGSAEST